MITADIYGITGAHRPWNVPTTPAVFEQCGTDSQEQINACLACETSDCKNCFWFKAPTQSNKFDKELFLQLYDDGLNDGDIADRFGVSQGTAWKWRRSLNLPTKFGRGRPKDE